MGPKYPETTISLRTALNAPRLAGADAMHSLSKPAQQLGWRQVAREICTLESLTWRQKRVRRPADPDGHNPPSPQYFQRLQPVGPPPLTSARETFEFY